MMNVLLIGDSIRIHAEPYVRAQLGARYEVFAPRENCASSSNVLAHFDQWLPAHAIDIIHINCGLHDLRYDPGAGQPVTAIETYRHNLHAIAKKIRKTGARFIWASSTPIDETLHNGNKPSRRYEADLLAYNAVARQVALEYGAQLNDLHAAITTHGKEALLLPDGIHFKPSGSALVGRLIAAAIMATPVNDR